MNGRIPNRTDLIRIPEKKKKEKEEEEEKMCDEEEQVPNETQSWRLEQKVYPV